MRKLQTLVLMCCLALSAAFCLAQGVAGTGNKKEVGHIIVKEKASNQQGGDKSESILATIEGHVLSVVFTENLGQVAIDISTAAGTSVDFSSLNTPNGVNFYIPLTGSYVVTFTLPNGDEYYGEFEVTD